MKKTLLFLLFGLSIGSYAQTKSTGVVSLQAGMTAKLDLNNTTSTATLKLTGPSDRWFALQFGSFNQGDGMQSGEDVVYYNGTTLVDAVHNGVGIAPTADTNNWTITSNTVATGTRTIIATRAFNTNSTGDYTFVYANGTIDFAFAKMGSATFGLAYHGNGNRGYKIDVPITTALGVDGFDKPESVIVYPNPASDSFSIKTGDEIKSVVIYNSNGKQITKFSNKKESLDISALAAGLYFVEIQNSEDQVSIERLVKK